MRGDLSRVADRFMCRRCDGTIHEADLAEDLMVDGETYVCVKSFCYLGYTLDGDGGADLAASAIIRNGWFESAEIQRIRWMCGFSMKDRRTNEELIRLVGVEPITTVIRNSRLSRYEYVMMNV